MKGTLQPASGTPEALVTVMLAHGIVPDGLGEIPALPAWMAQHIRDAGYTAVANRTWKCPILPHTIVYCTTLAHLSDAIERAWMPQPGGWGRFRSHPRYDEHAGLAHFDKVARKLVDETHCGKCRQPLVQGVANADVYAHNPVALDSVRKHLAAAAAAIGMTLTPANPTER